MTDITSADPIDNIQWVDATTLHPNNWNPNRVLSTEVQLLERSLLTLGWIQPVLANHDGLIIDGFHRWRITQDSPTVNKRWNGQCPVAFVDMDTPTAMATTVRINRAKGVHTGQGMADLCQAIVNIYGWTTERLGTEIGADQVELAHLLLTDVFAMKNTADHAYSAAWYPVGDTDQAARLNAAVDRPEQDDTPDTPTTESDVSGGSHGN